MAEADLAFSRSTNFWILPVEVFGSSPNTTARGVLKRARLARFKAPRAVVFGELPKTSTGKIQKFVLREKAKSAAAIDT